MTWFLIYIMIGMIIVMLGIYLVKKENPHKGLDIDPTGLIIVLLFWPIFLILANNDE